MSYLLFTKKTIMKKLLFLFCCLLPIGMYCQNNESIQEVNVPVQSAIIYLYGAEVSHTKQLTLNSGRNKIIFTGLSPKLNAKSIQVNASGGVSILAIALHPLAVGAGFLAGGIFSSLALGAGAAGTGCFDS